MKIFMGMINITSLYEEYRSGFEALGHEVFTAEVYRGPNQKDEPADLPIPDLAEARARQEGQDTPERRAHWKNFYMDMAWQKACEADVCIFLWQTFREDCRDLAQLKAMGKKIIVRFCGSEVRDDHAHAQFGRETGLAATETEGAALETLQKKLHYLRMSERYADLTIYSSVLGLRPFYGNGGRLMDTSGILPNTGQRQVPVILHAPSNRLTKGTSEFLLILEALRGLGLRFGTKIVEGLAHEQMLREYVGSDIYCGALYFGGKADDEAMAAGCVVLSPRGRGMTSEEQAEYYAPVLRALGLDASEDNIRWIDRLQGGVCVAQENPTIAITPENALEELAAVIQDWPRRQRLARQGVAYIKKYYDPAVVCGNILQMLDEPDKLEHRAALAWPAFFRQRYLPPDDPQRLALFNKYTTLVSRCPWYAQYITPGERAGLRF